MQSKTRGFTSLKLAKEKILKRKSKTPTTQEKEILQLNVEDPNFASLLNKNGVVQIGEQIFKITNQHTYIFKDRDAYQSFDFKKTKASNPTLSYVQPCHKQHQKLTKLRNDIYRADNCGSGGGGGGYNPGDDNTDLDVDKLDPNDNLNIDYPHKKTKEYRSGGTKGRLKGHSWNQYFWIYSSVGAKSEHQRHTWGRWWDRTADKITLESFIKYSYGEKKISFLDLKKSFNIKVRDLINTIDRYNFDAIDKILADVRNLRENQKLVRYAYDALTSYEYKIEIIKNKSRGEEVFTYDIAPTDLADAYSHSKSDAKRIRKVFDWSTAIINFPPGITDTAVDFELDILRSKHTMKHDGYHLGFITDNR